MTPRAPQQMTDREWVQYLVEKARALATGELFQVSVRAGIYTPQGQLTPEYGGPEPSAPPKKRARSVRLQSSSKKAPTKRSTRAAAR